MTTILVGAVCLGIGALYPNHLAPVARNVIQCIVRLVRR